MTAIDRRLVGFVAGAALAAFAACVFPVRVSADTGTVDVGRDREIGTGEVVTGSAIVVRGDLVVASGAVLEGDAVVVAGDARIAGTVSGDVAVVGGGAVVAGRIDGDLAATGEVVLEPEAVVTGDVSAPGGLRRARGSVVIGDPDRGVNGASGVGWGALGAGWVLLMTLLTMLLPVAGAVLATRLAPAAVRTSRDVISERPGRSLVVGVLLWAVSPFLVLLALPGLPIVLAVSVVVLVVGSIGLTAVLGGMLARGRGLAAQAGIGAAAATLPVAFGLGLGSWIGGEIGTTLYLWALALATVLAAVALGGGWLAVLRSRSATGAPDGRARAPQGVAASLADAVPSAGVEPVARSTTTVAADANAPSPPSAGDASPGAAAQVGAGDDALSAFPARALASPLRSVPGITPIYAYVLASAGIASFADLAAADPQHVVDLVARSGARPIDAGVATAWVAAAAQCDAR